MIKTNNRQSTIIQIKTSLRITAILVGLVFTGSVQALRFEPAEKFSIDFDTTLSYGAMWRMEEQDDYMMGPHGGPMGQWGVKIGADNTWNTADDEIGIASITPQFMDAVLAWNSDDGNRNFEKGDLVSDRVAMLNDIDFRYGNYGLFLRSQVFYDAVYFEETSWSGEGWDNWGITNPDGTPYYTGGVVTDPILNPTCGAQTAYNGCAAPWQIESDNNAYASREISDPSHFSDNTKDINGYNARFLDAFVYGTFHFADRTLDLRIGRQTISWGEALLLQGGIGFAQNRIDANAATSPGVEVKEIFLPTGAVYGQFDLSETLTLEAYWQYEWKASELFGTGSYFEGQDFLNSDIFLINQLYRNTCSFDFDDRNTADGGRCDNSLHMGGLADIIGQEHYLAATGNAMNRSPDVEPDHEGDQFGFALRKLLDNGSEMGFFFIQYHDKYPSLWAMNNGAKNFLVEAPVDVNGDFTLSNVNNMNVEGFNSQRYTIEYKERIKLLGISYNTVFEDIQMGFEVAYRPNQPVVPACTDKQLEEGTTDSSLLDDPVNPSAHGRYLRAMSYESACKDGSAKYLMATLYNTDNGSAEVPDSGTNMPGSGEVQGKLLAWPAQAELLTANWGVTLVVPPSPLWDTGIFVAELGGFYVGREYQGSGNFIGEFGSEFHNEDLKVTSIGSFTKVGYGISAIFLPQYKNIMEGVDLTIPFFINYGINGSFAYYNYTEGALWFSLGLEAVYLSNTRVGITYSTFGGDHMWNDRDNVAVTAKYTF
jgi:hypothetical protein